MCSIKSANLGNVMPQPLNLQMFIMKTAMSYNGNALVNDNPVFIQAVTLIIALNCIIVIIKSKNNSIKRIYNLLIWNYHTILSLLQFYNYRFLNVSFTRAYWSTVGSFERNCLLYRPIALRYLYSVSLHHSKIEHSKGRSPPSRCSLVSAAEFCE